MSVIPNVESFSDATSITKGTMETVSKVARAIRNNQSSSLVEYTEATRMRPLALVDEELRHQEIMPTILQTALSMFCGYLLQAVALDNQSVTVNAIKRIDKFNPRRSVRENANGAFANLVGSAEQYRHKLPDAVSISVEDNAVLMSGKDDIKRITEDSNLAVGKILEIVLSEGDHKVTIPVTVTLGVLTANRSAISSVLSVSGGALTLSERWEGFKGGELRFWKDLVFGMDLVDKHRGAILKDKSGLYKELSRRRTGNFISQVLSGQASVGDISNILVLSKATMRSIEREIGYPISSAKCRDRLFSITSAMILMVVDMENHGLTIWHRGFDGPSELSFKEIKNSSKGGDLNITDIVRAYSSMQSPSF